MSMFKPIRRLACVAAVGIAVLGWALPARADLEVTLLDTATSLSVTYSDTGSGTSNGLTYTAVSPGSFTLTGSFGNFTNVALTFSANYNASNGQGTPPPSSGTNASPPPGSPPSFASDTTATAHDGSGTTPDTLKISLSAGNWTLPATSTVTMMSGESASVLRSGDDTIDYQSTITTLPVSTSTSSTKVTITGPSPPSQSANSPNVSVANPGTLFALSSVFDLNFGPGTDSISATASTVVTGVPEPSTLAIAGLGALGMIGYGLRRRKARGA